MKCVADIHYDVVRRPDWPREIKGLYCNFCQFSVSKTATPMPRDSSSGLGRYNRMRGQMVRHLHQCHRDQLEQPRTPTLESAGASL